MRSTGRLQLLSSSSAPIALPWCPTVRLASSRCKWKCSSGRQVDFHRRSGSGLLFLQGQMYCYLSVKFMCSENFCWAASPGHRQKRLLRQGAVCVLCRDLCQVGGNTAKIHVQANSAFQRGHGYTAGDTLNFALPPPLPGKSHGVTCRTGRQPEVDELSGDCCLHGV